MNNLLTYKKLRYFLGLIMIWFGSSSFIQYLKIKNRKEIQPGSATNYTAFSAYFLCGF